jgi:acetyl-CoA acetyltransferase
MRPVHLLGGSASPLTKHRETPAYELARTTISSAIADAGLDRHAIDGLAVTPPGLAGFNTAMFVARLGEHLGIELRSLACLENGGCSAALALRWAILEVATGRCHAAVALGIDQRLHERPIRGERIESFVDRATSGTVAVYGPYDGVYGMGAPIPYYAMSAQRYMHETGATETDFAWAAVRLREHAVNNPLAVFRDKPITVDDVLESPMQSPPLHLLDCSQFVSGAAAVVVASEEVAAEVGAVSAALRGWGQAHHPSAFTTSTPDITRFPAVENAANEAFDAAGVTRDDIDIAEIYGVFSSTELMLTESLGFYDRGAAAAAFREGRTTHGGDLVIDPSGGRLSLGHPACATPLLSTVEILSQLRGGAGSRQVTDASLALVHAEHGMLNGSAVSIWERSEPK